MGAVVFGINHGHAVDFLSEVLFFVFRLFGHGLSPDISPQDDFLSVIKVTSPVVPIRKGKPFQR